MLRLPAKAVKLLTNWDPCGVPSFFHSSVVRKSAMTVKKYVPFTFAPEAPPSGENGVSVTFNAANGIAERSLRSSSVSIGDRAVSPRRILVLDVITISLHLLTRIV